MRILYIPDEMDFLGAVEKTPRKGILLNRTKTVKSGEWLECEIYPVAAVDHTTRTKRQARTREQMREMNTRNARKTVVRILNANFGPGDMLCHFTMEKPCSEEEFRRITKNFMERLRTRYRRRGAELKYLYVTESTGQGAGQRWHIHMAANGGVLTRDEMEAVWKHGLARADRAQEQEKGLAGFALYITQKKATQEKLLKRRWATSKGLRNPEKYATISDRKFSRRATQEIETWLRDDDMEALRKYFAKKYPGYTLVGRPECRYSDWLPGAYIYAWMKRSGKEGGKEAGPVCKRGIC